MNEHASTGLPKREAADLAVSTYEVAGFVRGETVAARKRREQQPIAVTLGSGDGGELWIEVRRQDKGVLQRSGSQQNRPPAARPSQNGNPFGIAEGQIDLAIDLYGAADHDGVPRARPSAKRRHRIRRFDCSEHR